MDPWYKKEFWKMVRFWVQGKAVLMGCVDGLDEECEIKIISNNN